MWLDFCFSSAVVCPFFHRFRATERVARSKNSRSKTVVIDIENGKRCINAYFARCCIAYVKCTFALGVCVCLHYLLNHTRALFAETMVGSGECEHNIQFTCQYFELEHRTPHNYFMAVCCRCWLSKIRSAYKCISRARGDLFSDSVVVVALFSRALPLLCRFRFVAIDKKHSFLCTYSTLFFAQANTQQTRTTDIHSIQAVCHSFALYSFTCYENTRKWKMALFMWNEM